MRIEKTHTTLVLLSSKYKKKISFPNYFNLARIFFLALLFTISLSSCKDKSFSDLAVQPADDELGISHLSNIGVTSYIQLDDSNRTDETNYNLLGSYIDPVFGKCDASFTSQFILNTERPNFDYTDSSGQIIKPTIDSVILSLVYSNYYADVSKLNGVQKVEVFELTKNTFVDSFYYSNLEIDTSYDASQLIGTKTFLPKLTTSVYVDSLPLIPQLRINLDTAVFGKKIMGIGPFNSSNLVDNATFIKYFKGVYVRVNNPFQTANQGGIIYFDLLNSNSKITTYYHNGSKYKGAFDYVMSSSSCARVNIFKHAYTFAPIIENQLNNPSLGQQSIYIQAMAGIRSKIEIPFLKQLIDSAPISIHKAELIFKIDEPFTGKYVPNARLFLFGLDSLGKKFFLPDQTENAFSGQYYGGYYDETNKSYRFNIARYVQLVATKKITDYGFYLVTGTTYESANRVVLKGGNNIQFDLTYTKL